MTAPTIIYTHTDEAPALATYSLLPIIQAFAATAGVTVETRDISLAARILSRFPDFLPEDRRVTDDLAELGKLVETPLANVIKLPNISASIPQLKAAIAELQSQGIPVPPYPDDPATEAERDIRSRYDAVKGSAVNPVIRQGNSDRRAASSVKRYAMTHPHRMGAWSPDSKTRVAHMAQGDFCHTERSSVASRDGTIRIVLDSHGESRELRGPVAVTAGDVLDASVMRASELDAFLTAQVAAAKEEGVLFSAHLKATMMKVSDPVIFGHVVRAFFPATFEAYGETLDAAGLSANDGLGTLFAGLSALPAGEAIRASFDAEILSGPALAMVDSAKGITNLHVPSDIIVDASMPAMIRQSGHMWGPDGDEHDTLAVIPDSSYAGVYQAVIGDCVENGAYDPSAIGSVPNVGLMANAAEEYGSHDKTFEIGQQGTVRVLDEEGTVLLSQDVAAGDIYRLCQTKERAIRDWVRLAVSRAKATGDPAVFWLDEARAHDAVLIAKVREYLKEYDSREIWISIMDPVSATRYSLSRLRAGENTISVTGNVLRDYLTDLFPIIELGTSAKMLSIVPLLAGGGLFETGAGGSAPKHVQQLLTENYLRWDSLGEFLALGVSLEKLADVAGNRRATVLADTLDKAVGRVLDDNRSPSRALGGLDNRGSHFYLARYWAEELARQEEDPGLAAAFAPLSRSLADDEEKIVSELNGVQGSNAEIGGYYRPDRKKAEQVMRPSATFNAALELLSAAAPVAG